MLDNHNTQKQFVFGLSSIVTSISVAVRPKPFFFRGLVTLF